MDPLLELLHQNAMIPRGDLAKMLNLSVDEIAQRIDRYEKEQVILGYQAVVDPERIDADAVTAFIEVSITPERGGGFDRLAERIARFDEVKSCWLMSGGYDLAILLEGNNLREIARFVILEVRCSGVNHPSVPMCPEVPHFRRQVLGLKPICSPGNVRSLGKLPGPGSDL